MSRWLVLVLCTPLAMASIAVDQDASIHSTSQDPFASLQQADKGAATIGTSGTQAAVTVAATAILIEDDVLDILSSDDSWQVHAEYRTHTGFAGALSTLTLRLDDGTLSRTEIIIADGDVTQASGDPVDVPTSSAAELRAVATLTATGSVELDLVLTRDAGPGPTLRYPVTITV